MRLSFELGISAAGAPILRVRLGSATVTDEHTLPYDEQKLSRLSRQLIDVLRRGNRTRALGEQALSELRFLGEELHRELIPPMLEAELERAAEPLLLDLDEALVPVPFELLHDGRSFLCRRMALGRAVRSSVTRRGQERRTLGMPPRALIIAADPRGDLPEVHGESEAIVEALEREKVRARLLGAADREGLRRELKDFDLVHFAGHADFLVDDPSGSGWHLSSGKLTAADVAELAGGRPMPLVIFSNACESGRTGGWTDGDGDRAARRAYGLAGAFLYAGVRHYVGTQWEVIDGHSATFATAFYRNLASGQAIGAAVRHAREAVVQSGGETALAWASYVLYGDPTDRPLKRTDPKVLPMPSAKALAERESAPWKRPTPQTMKRVGAELAARRGLAPDAPPDAAVAARRRLGPTARALLAGAGAGLVVTAVTAAVLWSRRPEPARLAILPIAAAAPQAAFGARVEACLEGALLAAGTPLTSAVQIGALAQIGTTGKPTAIAPGDDTRALALGAALGARWVLWGALPKDGATGEHGASLRLLEVKAGRLISAFSLPEDELSSSCAAEARKLAAALR